eukprot:g1473.t1
MTTKYEFQDDKGLSLRPPMQVDYVVEDIYQRLKQENTNIAIRWRRLKADTAKLQRNKALLEEEELRLAEDRNAFRAEKEFLEEIKTIDWKQQRKRPKTYRLNIGGQVFETTATVLKKDPHSMLAALCADDSPLNQPNDNIDGDGEAEFYVERDWWLFRYILQYLRHGVLPLDASGDLVRQLYREAEWYGLETMRSDLEQLLYRARSNMPGADTGYGMGLLNPDSDGNLAEGAKGWLKPRSHRGYWPMQERGSRNYSWWDGSNYKGVPHGFPQYGDFKDSKGRNKGYTVGDHSKGSTVSVYRRDR